MSRMSFFRRSLLLLCLPTVLAAQNGPTVKLEDFNLTQVLRGDPQLLGELKGRVVVLTTLSLTDVKGQEIPPPVNDTSESRRAYAQRKYEAQQQAEKNWLSAKNFAREFNRVYVRYEDHASVRCIGLLSQWAPSGNYLKPKPMTPEIAEEHAKAIGFKAPILKTEMVPGTVMDATHSWVMVFNAAGVRIYNGEAGSQVDKAVRDALKELAP